jgi:hypothetical protein
VAAEYAVVAILKVTSSRRKVWGSEFVQAYSPGRRRKKKASQMRSARAACSGLFVHCWPIARFGPAPVLRSRAFWVLVGRLYGSQPVGAQGDNLASQSGDP